MGNCLKPMMTSRESHVQNKLEETKPLVTPALHEKVVLSSDECHKKKKKVRFNLEADNPTAEATIMETTNKPTTMKKSVRVKVVLTQSELKKILSRATIYHPPPPMKLPPSVSSVDLFSGQIMVKCRRSRSSSLMCKCKCGWNPALQTIPELGHY
ncbi:hypothetical protein CTI12_AA574730 [Artemisia annua]|uniref:Uncharacterized protein n=1 Tax=Artemisia annua TaxID=35608 RepID=A0A2U1KKK3_ARTAN|nr:hypothetical protein CTI12_AA574730 [Artemisia annua]